VRVCKSRHATTAHLRGCSLLIPRKGDIEQHARNTQYPFGHSYVNRKLAQTAIFIAISVGFGDAVSLNHTRYGLSPYRFRPVIGDCSLCGTDPGVPAGAPWRSICHDLYGHGADGGPLAGSLAHKLGAPLTVGIGGVIAVLGALFFALKLPALRPAGREMIVAQQMAGGTPAEEMPARVFTKTG
jgi:hypothetical protein